MAKREEFASPEEFEETFTRIYGLSLSVDPENSPLGIRGSMYYNVLSPTNAVLGYVGLLPRMDRSSWFLSSGSTFKNVKYGVEFLPEG